MTQSKQNSMNRKNGEDFERKLVNKFKKRSDVLYVQRGAGSFGVWDIMVQFIDGTVLYISAKINGYHDWQERMKILKFLRKVKRSKMTNVRMEMHYYKSTRITSLMRIKTEGDVDKLETMRRVMV